VKAFLLLLSLFLTAPALPAQAPEGIWQGYDGEWKHVSQQLIALAEATPAEKFSWRPAPGVRSTSEVYMHIVIADFFLLGVVRRETPRNQFAWAHIFTRSWFRRCISVRACISQTAVSAN